MLHPEHPFCPYLGRPHDRYGKSFRRQSGRVGGTKADRHLVHSSQWVRPPDIRLFDIDLPSSNAVAITTSSLSLNFSLIIGYVYTLPSTKSDTPPADHDVCSLMDRVTNPNWFSADFKEISAVYVAQCRLLQSCSTADRSRRHRSAKWPGLDAESVQKEMCDDKYVEKRC